MVNVESSEKTIREWGIMSLRYVKRKEMLLIYWEANKCRERVILRDGIDLKGSRILWKTNDW